MKKIRKTIGIGSISIILFIIGFSFGLTLKNGVCFGDDIYTIEGYYDN